MKQSRRDFIKQAAVCTGVSGFGTAVTGCGGQAPTKADKRPNVIMIMTDDQGYGDVGFHGNDIIKTPNIDRFAAENLEFTRFYVCPTCAPTRAGLMTGRYHHRTGILGTMGGEALINPEETSVAEMLSSTGYRTGIFGKWHLGDNHPRRPIDMGFDEMLIHNGGGLSQPSCPPGVGYNDPAHQKKHNYVPQEANYRWMSSNNYFDPVLNHNGVEKQYEGYCTDIFFDAAMDFIEEDSDEPFFVYLPTNAPHCPEVIGEDYLEPYRAMGLDDHTARCYAMITNIDDNFGRLQSKLDRLGITDNTILIFFCDNGAFGKRFSAGLRGRKKTLYEGGIRTPFVISWPDKIKSPDVVDRIAANIDLMPTILDACGVDVTYERKLDGKSLMPLIEDDDIAWPERTLFFQGYQGIPEIYNHCAAMTQRYKLVDGSELYDLENDPGETNDIADDEPEILARLRDEYEAWFSVVCETGRGFSPQRIWLGTKHENPVRLTRNDWRGPRSRFLRIDTLGWWEVDVRTRGEYSVEVGFDMLDESTELHFKLGMVNESAALDAGTSSHTFGPLELPDGEGRLETWLERDGETIGVYDVKVKINT